MESYTCSKLPDHITGVTCSKLPHHITGLYARRDSVPYAALYIAPILIDTRLHSTRGQFIIRHECGAMYMFRTDVQYVAHGCFIALNR